MKMHRNPDYFFKLQGEQKFVEIGVWDLLEIHWSNIQLMYQWVQRIPMCPAGQTPGLANLFFFFGWEIGKYPRVGTDELLKYSTLQLK